MRDLVAAFMLMFISCVSCNQSLMHSDVRDLKYQVEVLKDACRR